MMADLGRLEAAPGDAMIAAISWLRVPSPPPPGVSLLARGATLLWHKGPRESPGLVVHPQ